MCMYIYIYIYTYRCTHTHTHVTRPLQTCSSLSLKTGGAKGDPKPRDHSTVTFRSPLSDLKVPLV